MFSCLIWKSCDNIFYVVNVCAVFLTLLFSVISTTTQNIEKSFLQNNPKILYSLFSSKSSVSISLPDPISFSDQVTNQQAYFFFRKTFTSFSTSEFYAEEEPPTLPEEQYFIFKAKWSFTDKKNNKRHVFRIFFFLIDEDLKNTWRIIEIKAEKI